MPEALHSKIHEAHFFKCMPAWREKLRVLAKKRLEDETQEKVPHALPQDPTIMRVSLHNISLHPISMM
jgi:hypothetical protein